VLCVDAAQFPPDVGATFGEAHRVLEPGGLAVVTGWEARDPDDPAVQSLRAEGRRVVDRGDPVRRVLATGRRPR
jgi:hypothetical protein